MHPFRTELRFLTSESPSWQGKHLLRVEMVPDGRRIRIKRLYGQSIWLFLYSTNRAERVEHPELLDKGHEIGLLTRKLSVVLRCLLRRRCFRDLALKNL